MGNCIATSSGCRRKKAKVMKLNGELLKLKTPISAMDVVKDYPGHVLMDSKSVKRLGIRAKPLELNEELKPNKVYFLVELPKMLDHVRISAEDRLEYLMISRRPAAAAAAAADSELLLRMKKQKQKQSDSGDLQLKQVKVKLRRSQFEKVMADSHDYADFTEKILGVCLEEANCIVAREPVQEERQGSMSPDVV